MSASGLVSLPPRVVEVATALSIVGIAALNLLRVVGPRWDLGFELGLIHGLGFALWLEPLTASVHRLPPVLGFAVGIVLGEALFVAGAIPPLFLIRRTLTFRMLLWFRSAAAALGASFWIVWRAAG